MAAVLDLMGTSYRYEHPLQKQICEYGPERAELRQEIDMKIRRLEKILHENKLTCWKSDWDECEPRPCEYKYDDYGAKVMKDERRGADANRMIRKIHLIQLFHKEFCEYRKELSKQGKAIYCVRL